MGPSQQAVRRPGSRVTRLPVIVASILRPEGTTGVHTYVRELRRYLTLEGVNNELVTPFSWMPGIAKLVFSPRLVLEHFGAPASVLWYRYWHTVFLAQALRERLARLGPVLVYAQGPEAARAALAARQGAHQPVIMCVHFLGSQARGWVAKGYFEHGSPAERRIRLQEREVVRRLDGIVYVSQSSKDRLLAEVPEARRLPSGIVRNFVSNVETHGSGGQSGDLVTVGGLEVDKGHEYILRVLSAAKQAGYQYTLDIYGSGPLARQLRTARKQLGLENQVRLKGYNPRVREVLPCYRCYVHACPVEVGPLAMIEALAAGLPIVAPAEGGAGEVFSPGVEGLRLPLGDVDAAARVLVEVLEDEERRLAMGKRSRARFEALFDPEVSCPRLLSFFESIARSAVDGKRAL